MSSNLTFNSEKVLKSKLTFGTAGIRGKFGLGEGRLNKFTIENWH